MSKYQSLKDAGANYNQRFVFTDNVRQNTSNKVKKSSKNGQGQKTSIFTFAKFLTTIDKDVFLDRRLVTRLCFHLILRLSFYFLIFEDIML